MRQREDLTGKRFGRLVVLKKGEDYVSPKGEKRARWICQCDCGNVVLRSSNLLKKGESLSCGCYRKDALREIKTIDLTGQRFGRLVVTKKDTDNHKKGTYWICHCDCGNVVSVSSNALRQRKTVSCGCYQREIAGAYHFEDLTGKRFGRLVVLKKSSKKQNNKIYWICRCDCGNVVSVSGGNLKNGGTTQCKVCGIEQVREKRIVDLTGQRFGRLVVTKKDTDNHKKGTYWICHCDCGNVVSVSAGALKSDNTKSCGCVQSHSEMIVLDILKSFGLKEGKDFIRHKTFEKLTGIKGGLLSYDYAIIDSGEILSLLECQGQQHYFPVELFGGEKQFEIQKEHDKRKRVFAQKNELPLICLRYSLSEKDIKEVLEELIFGEKLPHGE